MNFYTIDNYTELMTFGFLFGTIFTAFPFLIGFFVNFVIMLLKRA